MSKHNINDPDFEQRVKVKLQAIGRYLHTLRDSRKQSLKTVGKRVRMSPTLISKIEKGEHNFKLTQLFRLAKYYKTSIYDIFKQAENETDHLSAK